MTYINGVNIIPLSKIEGYFETEHCYDCQEIFDKKDLFVVYDLRILCYECKLKFIIKRIRVVGTMSQEKEKEELYCYICKSDFVMTMDEQIEHLDAHRILSEVEKQ